MFSFTSMGAAIDYKINTGSGPYVFKISGQVHHLMGSMLPSNGECPKYAQLYIYDTKNEVLNRLNAIDPTHDNINIKLEIIEGLIKMFDEINELVKEFRTIRDKFENRSLPSLNMTILNRQLTDSKQYEEPTSEEIGGLIVGDIGEHNSNRDIIIELNSGKLQRISKIHLKYMSLQYPILFPYGEDGYKINLQMHQIGGSSTQKRQKISMRAYITYHIQDRNNEISTLLKGGRLFQQYLVDAYATVEEDRLDWIRRNQNNFRSETFKHLCAAASAGFSKGRDLGQKIILPSSHTGSPRDMINNYQDAMAICRQYGNPDLFITFTCNVKWPEIERYLKNMPIYKVEDRPDIISRMFKIKLDDMIKYIKSGKPFGEIEADVHTIEFQKRGLPHAHMLFWLKKDYKCYTATDIDSIISAELLDKNVNPELFKVVSEFMIHGPCGEINPKSPCMRNGKCSKFFPKPYNTNTIFETNTPPIYRRREDHAKFVVKNNVHIGNNFVVPYNSNLLLRYNAHINVESCSQSMLIKYLFKYINKGPDRARLLLHDDLNDEITSYLNCRYLTPHESVWRLFEYSIHSRHPAVQHLHIHMPLEQNIVFNEFQYVQSIIKEKSTEDTTLTGWFKANSIYPDASKLTYTEFPSKFVWNNRNKCWTPRKQCQTIGRIVHVPPTLSELYFMRMLLNIQKGCQNYDAIKTINGITYNSYQEACQALGLLGDDKEWTEALSDSLYTATASEIRQLFVTIILFCDVANPEKLLNLFWLNMCDDILHNTRIEVGNPNLILSESELKNKLLYELEQMFNKSSSSLKDYRLPMPNVDKILNLNNRLLKEELDYDCIRLKHEHANLVSQLNAGQKIVYDEVIKAIKEKTCNTFFVHGHGGTGKTFLWHTIICKLRSEGKIVLAVASSGIASLLLPKGRTAHSRFKIPLTINNSSICLIKKGTHLAELVSKTELIIWDEAPMSNKYCFEALDKSFRDIII
ncbi:putative DNA helicase Pif1, helitron helicase-like domain-containing protein [Rosa chinensis]|uniref:ATP-dependent DNA helicase n=1 Tax=Rosa chinensis TaxID=74649 RepID=A0A2P6Q3K9_ROSCH|nr:putative DNA helicase Pif1, helitron helicase-like domain-containing protein [Rosa chinensis]